MKTRLTCPSNLTIFDNNILLPELAVTFCMLYSLASIIANSVVLSTLYMKPELQTVANCLMASVCIAGFSHGVGRLPLIAAVILMPDSRRLCSVKSTLLYIGQIFAMAQGLCILATCVDRVCRFKLQSRYTDVVTKEQCRIALLIIWMVSILTVMFQEDINSGSMSPSALGIVPSMFLAFAMNFYIARKINMAIRSGETYRLTGRKRSPQRKTSVLVPLLATIFTWLPSGVVSTVYRNTTHFERLSPVESTVGLWAV